MKARELKMEPADPQGRTASRQFFQQLREAIGKMRRPGWFLVAEFAGDPRRAHDYRNRLRAAFKGTREFGVETTDGVGKLYCRIAEK